MEGEKIVLNEMGDKKQPSLKSLVFVQLGTGKNPIALN